MFHVLGKIIMIKTDVLVIGAGPAGSSAARFAAKEGVDVIIIDKKSEIGFPKRCAEGKTKSICLMQDMCLNVRYLISIWRPLLQGKEQKSE